MGCVSSKLIMKEMKQEIGLENGDGRDHFVSLTSSTIGVLKLEKEKMNEEKQAQEEEEEEEEEGVNKQCAMEEAVKKSPACEDPSPEVINAWELMEGLEEEAPIKRSPKARVFRLGFGDLDAKTPLKLLSQVGFSPRRLKRSSAGKENRGSVNKQNRGDFSPSGVLKPRNSTESPWRLRILKRGSPNDSKCESLRIDSGVFSTRRRSLGPLFDPELVASIEKELFAEEEEEEQIKKMVSTKSIKDSSSETNLETFERKCPPGGENSAVIYTTTLRGIRKTFEDCNVARSIIQSHQVQVLERDVSMHSGYKEELRRLIWSKDVRVPLLFVKGRMIGGAEVMVRLEEEGRLGILLSGLPRASATCRGCGGIRFVMCRECSGSSKVLGEDGRRSLKCGECNENGLTQCPICC